MDIWIYILITFILLIISKGSYDADKMPEVADTVTGLLKDLKGMDLVLEEMGGFTEEDIMSEFELFEPEDLDFNFETGGDEMW